jgi:integral membrane sensor domain MASE1
MFVIKLLILVGLLIYAGYFRGWNGWCLIPLVVLFAIYACIEGSSQYSVQNVSNWIMKPLETFVFWIPTVTMAVYGKEGRKTFAIRCESAWAWIQNKRQ